MKVKKILFLVSEDQYFCSHRLNLAKAALAAGFEVAVATRCQNHMGQIHEAGIKLFSLKFFTRTGLAPLTQLKALIEIYRIFRQYQPDITHHVAIKPIIFGSIIASITRIPKVINALGGLGYLFTELSPSTLKKKILSYAVSKLFTWCFTRKNSTLILQNSDDLNNLNKAGIYPHHHTIIRGAGVDPQAYPVQTYPKEPPLIIACVARLLRSKGIAELVEATRTLKQTYPHLEVHLYGMPDPENPESITTSQLNAWQDANVIYWKGQCETVAEAYAKCHLAVLPSYREGLPKSLLEAASCARPIVTTDVPGCREVVKHNENGLLVSAQDSQALASAIHQLLADRTLRITMGNAGRARVEHYFSDEIIQKQTLALYTT